MVVFFFVNRFDIKKFSGRLRDSLAKSGYHNAPSTHRALAARKSDLSMSAVKNHLNGDQSPNVRHVADYCDLAGVSSDWLLFGKQPESPSIEQFKSMIDAAVAEKGFALRDLDPDIAKVMQALIDLEPSERAPLAAMVEAYVNQRKGM